MSLRLLIWHYFRKVQLAVSVKMNLSAANKLFRSTNECLATIEHMNRYILCRSGLQWRKNSLKKDVPAQVRR